MCFWTEKKLSIKCGSQCLFPSPIAINLCFFVSQPHSISSQTPQTLSTYINMSEYICLLKSIGAYIKNHIFQFSFVFLAVFIIIIIGGTINAHKHAQPIRMLNVAKEQQAFSMLIQSLINMLTQCMKAVFFCCCFCSFFFSMLDGML